MVSEKRFFRRERSVEPEILGTPRLTQEDKAAITRKFMNTPVYPSRLRQKGLQAKRGGKLLPHPMRSAE